MKHSSIAQRLGQAIASVCLVLVTASGHAAAGPAAFGTYLRPFAADSLWNSRPVDPVLGDFVIPKSDYTPNVAEGSWSTGVFLAKSGDRPMTVYPVAGKNGVWDPDAEQEQPEVVIPRWPDDVAAAAQADGHADIVDPVEGVVHSFWQLKKVDGRWTATQYAWSALAGRGWGDPAHYQQGARAAGVPTSGGLIRKHEIDDGERLYHHALAVSLTFDALSAAPIYTFPATSADHDAASVNKGPIPEGALLMLPPSFDAQKLFTPSLRKVAETLKVHGAWVVDRNTGTPFNIYVELGSGFNLHKGGWSNTAVADLESIRVALRQVTATKGWIDGNGKAFTPDRNLNLLSLRGAWQVQGAGTAGRFQTRRQAVVFAASPASVVQMNASGNGLYPALWALPAAGRTYRVTAATTGGGKLRIVLRDRGDGRVAFDSGALANGESKTFAWPTDAAFTVFAISGVGQVSSVGGTLVATERGRT